MLEMNNNMALLNSKVSMKFTIKAPLFLQLVIRKYQTKRGMYRI